MKSTLILSNIYSKLIEKSKCLLVVEKAVNKFWKRFKSTPANQSYGCWWWNIKLSSSIIIWYYGMYQNTIFLYHNYSTATIWKKEKAPVRTQSTMQHFSLSVCLFIPIFFVLFFFSSGTQQRLKMFCWLFFPLWALRLASRLKTPQTDNDAGERRKFLRREGETRPPTFFISIFYCVVNEIKEKMMLFTSDMLR